MQEEMPVRLRADPERVRVSVRREGSAWKVRIESRSAPNMNNVRTTTPHPPSSLEDILREAAEFIDGIELDPSQSDRGFAHPFGRTSSREEYGTLEGEEEENDMHRFMTDDGTLCEQSEVVMQVAYQLQVETMVREMLDRGASIAEVAWSLQCIVGTAIESVRNERWTAEIRDEIDRSSRLGGTANGS